MSLLNNRKLGWLSVAVALAAPASIAPLAHAQEQLWLRQFGTNRSERADALASDGAGGVIVAGFSEGSLGGPLVGWRDAFLARYDGAGDQLWIRQFGTNTWDVVYALAPDGAGGVVAAGQTLGSLGGPHAGGNDAFLARYDTAGNQLWIRQFGTSVWESAYALAPDGAGGVLVAGETAGSLVGSRAGGYDIFLAHYDSAGNQTWIRQFGTSSNDTAFALAPDGAGGVMVAGSTTGSLGGPNLGLSDAFLARYDSAGNQLWIRQFGTNNEDTAKALGPDGAGGVIVAGSTAGSLGGPNAGGRDAFLARFNGAGDPLWIRQFGSSSSDYFSALAPDGGGGVLVAGYTRGSLGGPNIGLYDAILARYDSAGDQLWIHQFGTSSSDYASALALDGAGGVVVAGSTQGSLGGPYAGGFRDAFLARYTTGVCPCACDWDGSAECTFFDFLFFQNEFVAANPCACEFDGDPACTFFDFLFFQNQFVTGCP